MPGVISPGDSRTVGELAALKWEYAEGRPELHTAVKLAMGGILQVTTRRAKIPPSPIHPRATAASTEQHDCSPLRCRRTASP
jgi:hypothetical protein